MKETTLLKTAQILSILGLLLSSALFFPHIREMIISFGESALNKPLVHEFWNIKIIDWAWILSLSFLVFLVISIKPMLPYQNQVFRILCFIGLFVGIAVSFAAFFYGGSLWMDEAAVAGSVIQRSWSELLATPLDGGQSAPALYVVTVKLIGSVFNYSECGLRLITLLLFVGTLLLLTHFLKSLKYSNIKILFVVCLAAITPSFIYYSNELKPYISDAFFCVLTFLLYWFYLQKRLNIWTLAGISCAILLFCSPAIFFIGGIFLIEFISAVKVKNQKSIVTIILLGCAIIAFFTAYYLLWLSGAVDAMDAYWNSGMKNISISNIINIFTPLDAHTNSIYLWLFAPLASVGMYHSIKQKNSLYNAIIVSIVLALFASVLEKWPLAGRLWMFLPIMIFMFSLFGYEQIKNKISSYKTLIICFCITLISALSINAITNYKFYKAFNNADTNPLISYVYEHIQVGEMLYVYPGGTAGTVLYKTNYTHTIGNVLTENIIVGKDHSQWSGKSDNHSEFERIIENDKVYLMFSHHIFRGGIDYGLQYLQQYGTITKVLEVHETPLYYFERKE